MSTAALADVAIDDKYRVDHGRVFISGRQALVRLPMLQRRLDRLRGLNTAGFVSGYRGSPLGGYDSELWHARAFLDQHDIVFQPGLNEDLAATAIWGTQQLDFFPGRKVDGVFAIWYGKGPGVDRSGDVLKHANMAGTARNGGVLLVFGDDHAGKSSTLAHQSDRALAAHDIPVLYPASVAEIIEYGLAGFALSRYSGLLVGLKIVNETAEATSIVTIDADGCGFVEPAIPDPPGGVNIRKEFLAVQTQDIRLVRHKLPRAREFARANRLDRIAFGAARSRFVIVTAGKSYPDVMTALGLLGIEASEAQRLGLAVYKVAMIYPLEPTGLRSACAEAEEILFVEEKRPHVEAQAATALFNMPRRPRLSGKADPQGEPLLPSDVPLDPLTIAEAIARRLQAMRPDLVNAAMPLLASHMKAVQERLARAMQATSGASLRRPTFCAGCPHNISTTVPADAIGMTGIGCHGMAVFMPERNPYPVSHMGGEGATWLGTAPFTHTSHVFQNLGDGTYNHSGSLAIRAAVQAKINITYKILYNDAVAMTGGQPVEGGASVGRIAEQLMAEGVKRVAVVSDQPERFRATRELPAQVALHHRDELDSVQRALREIPGVTALVYDQACAAEKRRRRKRGLYPDPDWRIFINHLVCEGCGDCSVQSNCAAIQPLETDLGRKRAIDQSACNKDASCVKGFCPSFVTVHGARLKQSRASVESLLPDSLPEPSIPPLEGSFGIVITGIGGTGVVTIGAIIGMAAHLVGASASVYDMTGLSQKGGAVLSHVRLSAHSLGSAPVQLAAGEADLIIACDVLAAMHREVIQAIDGNRTTIVANSNLAAPADFSRDPDMSLDGERFLRVLRELSDGREPLTLPAQELGVRLLADSIAVNMIMLGFAWQSGRVPLLREAIERAIELNGVAVARNLEAFRIGRAAAVTSFAPLLSAAQAQPSDRDTPTGDLDLFVARRIEDLTAYRNARYAAIYERLVTEGRRREAQLGLETNAFGWALARGAFKLMAYKDEYEVARLYSDGRFREALAREFEPGYRLSFHLAPPILARSDPRTNRPRKITLGPWTLILFALLARLKFLRETPFDPFGYTAERKLERRLRDEYLRRAGTLCDQLSAANHADAVALAEAPRAVQGFGIVKERAARALLASLAHASF